MNKLTATTILTLGSLAAGCAGPGGTGIGGKADGSMTSGVSCKALYTPALMSVPDVGYRVTSTDRPEGLITALQDVTMGEGSSVGLTTMLQPLGKGCVLRVTVQAPPAGLILVPLSVKVDDYIAAVERRVGTAQKVAGASP